MPSLTHVHLPRTHAHPHAHPHFLPHALLAHMHACPCNIEGRGVDLSCTMRVHIIVRTSTCYILPIIHTNYFMILHVLLKAREWSGNVMLALMHDDGCTKPICIRTFTCYILPLVPTRHSNFFVNL